MIARECLPSRSRGPQHLRLLARRKERRSRTGWRDDRGSSTIIVAGLISVLCVVGAAVVLIAAARHARHQADSAADLAALAGAVAMLDGSGDPCAAASDIATRNGAALTDCSPQGQTIYVTVTVDVSLGRWGIGQAHARARAGPVEAANPTVDS